MNRTAGATRNGHKAVEDVDESGKLGTLGGVFTPSVLTILGLVLFLRLGYVTGNVGLIKMLIILGLATTVSLLTTISLAAIATNLKVGGGGVYFLISRTLGPAFGGAIGLVLYLAMAVSVAFYAIGLGEAVSSVIETDNANAPRLIAAVTIVALLGLTLLGADVATRLQYVVLACLIVAIGAYFVGAVGVIDFDRLSGNISAPPGGESFWISFAIFFPAITGFTQGVAMSGDLKTPSRSISIGTFGAIGVSTLIYLLVIFTFVLAVPLDELRTDTAIMRRLAPAPWLIDLGVIAATLSSAIASMMGAPRTLQKLAADRLIAPLRPFAIGSGPANNPRRGVALTAAIALVTVALGDLDVVAPVISMFFLASYGMINYATYSEARAASTSFRPRFRYFDWRLSLLGTLACVGVILAIDPLAGALAGAAVFGLYRYLRRSVQQARWADSTRGFHTSEVRSHLKQMAAFDDASRDWRPCTVAFVPRDPQRRSALTTVATWFEGGAGFTTAARIIVGRGAFVRKQAARVDLELQRELDADGDRAYGRVLVAENIESGVAAMLQGHGIGALRANLALFSWYDLTDPERSNPTTTSTMVRTGIRFNCNVGIVHAPQPAWEALDQGSRQVISVWWSDRRTGQLLTILAWMCTRTPMWKKATIEVWVAADGGDGVDTVTELLDDGRIRAAVRGVAGNDDFVAKMSGASLALAPVRIRHGQALGPGDVPIDQLVEDLGVVVFAHASSVVELDAQPDEGGTAVLADAHDRATELTERARELSVRAGQLMVEAELAKMEVGYDPGAGDQPPVGIEEAAVAAHRTYIDARARAEEAWRVVRELDPTASSEKLDPELWVGANGDQLSHLARTKADRQSTS